MIPGVQDVVSSLLPTMLTTFPHQLSRVVAPSFARAAHTTAPYGRSAILQKNPDDVVITFAKRTAIGRARKGQLKDAPVDEILQALIKVLSTPSDLSIAELIYPA